MKLTVIKFTDILLDELERYDLFLYHDQLYLLTDKADEKEMSWAINYQTKEDYPLDRYETVTPIKLKLRS